MNIEDKNAPPAADKPKGDKPTYELLLVQDRGEGKKANWVKLTGLWATKDGKGLTGQLKPHTTVPAGARLVIMPAKSEDGAAQ